ncbi:MAG: Omp28-related outer membrane protein [Bacteroidales bacterium]
MKQILFILKLIFIATILITIHSCKKDPPKEIPKLTTAVSDLAPTSVNATGGIESDGGSEISSRGFCWDTNPNPTTNNQKSTNGSGSGTFTAAISGLNPGTLYYLRSYAINGVGTGYGNSVSVTTPAQTPALTTSQPSSITSTTLVTGGNITGDGGASITARGVCWDTNQNPTILNASAYSANNEVTQLNAKTSDGSGKGEFVSSINGLLPGTTYYLRAYATNSAGTSYGNQITAVTLATAPVLTTAEASSITSTTAICGGNISSDGGSPVTERGVCWSTSQNPTISNSKTSFGSGSGNFSGTITGLILGTTYYLRAYATNSKGTAYGNQITFNTASTFPSITTIEFTPLTPTSAQSGGNISSDGGNAILSRGVCWSREMNPTITDNKTENGSGTGSYTSVITGLTPGAYYYIRAYATFSGGISYGNNVVGHTVTTIPEVTTEAVSAIEQNSVKSGGNVINDGGATVISRGVCWSTSPEPTTINSKTTDGNGTGIYTSTVTGLSPGTTYYIRAYATNSNGTVYGNQISFSTAAPNAKFEKNVLIEQYTGTWCGYCPRAISQIDNLYSVNKKIVHIALHLSDQMTFIHNNALFTSFGFTGVPTVHLDRLGTWSGNNSTVASLQTPADAGVAINVTASGNNVNATVQSNFGVNFPEGVKISVYMLEDGIVANQANYYNTDSTHPFYGKGNPVPNFVHNNVIIKIATDMFGDLIPASEVGAGKIYSRNFSFSNISADKISKVKVVAFLTYNGGSKQKQVINAAVAAVGENKGFVYL